MASYGVEWLANGLVTIIDRSSGLRGLYQVTTGAWYAGDLALDRDDVLKVVYGYGL